ncbi:MAG: amidohydrolase family protein [Chloroflexi bacterium]|nr:amidohydrolase family protein [Chloroflexota bacterium]MCY3937025.1 amidohydrolase family protein [Chloroflexota bacterium]
MIIDCHTHVFSPDVIEDRELHARSEPWFQLLYGSGAKMATADDLLKSMDSAGIDKSVVMSFGWKSDEACAAGNDYAMEAALKSGNRLIPFIAVSPTSEDTAVREIERWAGTDVRGVGELYADGQGFDLEDYGSISTVTNACVETDLFLCIHITEPVGHDYAGKDSTDTRRLWNFLSSAPPDLKLLLSHWGGGFGFYELMPEVAERSGEWYYDTAASHLLYDDRVYSIMDRLAPGRVLFGSDYPLTQQSRMLGRVRKAGLSESQYRALVGENAVRAGLG